MVLRGSRFKWRRDCLPRLWKGVAVYTALLITPAGDVQEITVYSPSAINAILRDSCVDCLTSNDGVIDFWFRSAVAGRYRPNQQATGLLLSVTTFSVRTVPLLYGSVVVCSKSSDGRLLGLTTQDRRGALAAVHPRSRPGDFGAQYRSAADALRPVRAGGTDSGC